MYMPATVWNWMISSNSNRNNLSQAAQNRGRATVPGFILEGSGQRAGVRIVDTDKLSADHVSSYINEPVETGLMGP